MRELNIEKDYCSYIFYDSSVLIVEGVSSFLVSLVTGFVYQGAFGLKISINYK
jgi:hypothetical protein